MGRLRERRFAQPIRNRPMPGIAVTLPHVRTLIE